MKEMKNIGIAMAAKKLAKKKMACGGEVKMAEGGEVSEKAKAAAENIKDVQVPKLMIILHPDKMAENIMHKKANMADGGMIDQQKAKKFEKGFGYGEKEERPVDFNQKAGDWIASKIGMKKKASYAHGGEVDLLDPLDGLDGAELEGDEEEALSASHADFLSGNEPVAELEQEKFQKEHEDPVKKKKRMINEIMDELHKGHYGKS